MADLGVAGRAAAELAEALQLVERQVVAGEVQEAVEQHAAVAGRKDEPVAVDPGRLGRVMFHETVPQYISHRRRTERQARVA